MPSQVRRATPADNAALCTLISGVPMSGAVRVSAQRGPDYFALYDMQDAAAEVYVPDDDEMIGAAGSVLVRKGWWRGELLPIGYLGDLRSRGFTRRSRVFPRTFADILNDVGARHGCSTFFACVMADNDAALNALARPDRPRAERRRGQPRFELFRRYHGVCVHFVRRPRYRPTAGLSVSIATPAELPEISAFLAADHERRPFGYAFGDGELEHRLARWPGFTLEHTYLCRDENGALVGATTAWDAAAVRRYRVEGYSDAMRLGNSVFNALAGLSGGTRLPHVGEDLRYFFLANLSVANDEQRVLRALIDRVYADFFGRGYHFFMLPMYEGDPLAGALTKGARWTTFLRRLPFHMYLVSPDGAAPTPPSHGRPGFEIALA